VRVTEVKLGDLAETMELLESAMRFSFRKWHQCHQCGELTKYGSSPQGEPTALRTSRFRLELAEEETSSPDREAELTRRRAEVAEEEAREPEYDLLEEARKTLDILWVPIDPYVKDPAMESSGNYHKLRLLKYCHPKVMELLILLTAMVSCQVPLSAAIWAQRHFLPVRVYFKKYHILGLLAKHAWRSNDSNGQVMISGG
jgi:hypothetical protein